MRLPFLTSAATVLLLAAMPLKNKAFGQQTFTPQDTISFVRKGLIEGSKALGDEIAVVRSRQSQDIVQDSLIPSVVKRAIQSAQKQTRPIAVTVIPSGHPNVDATFSQYALAFQEAFNDAVAVSPKTVAKQIRRKARPSLLSQLFGEKISIRPMVEKQQEFCHLPGSFSASATKGLALEAYSALADAMMKDGYLASFTTELASSEDPNAPQVVTLHLVPVAIKK